jgi:hypothetical protein
MNRRNKMEYSRNRAHDIADSKMRESEMPAILQMVIGVLVGSLLFILLLAIGAALSGT